MSQRRTSFPSLHGPTGLGLWKQLYLSDQPAVEIANASDQVKRGQYLTEALGHCGECHTPRNAIGGRHKQVARRSIVA